MLILIEGIVVCFILLLVCVVGLKDGPEKYAVFMIGNVFDRLFIDEFWVGHTKAWFIPGTEDLMPYIPVKVK